MAECLKCGGPIRSSNTTGYCSRTRACRTAQQTVRYARNTPEQTARRNELHKAWRIRQGMKPRTKSPKQCPGCGVRIAQTTTTCRNCRKLPPCYCFGCGVVVQRRSFTCRNCRALAVKIGYMLSALEVNNVA